MSYLINSTRPALLIINNVDYTQHLLNFQVSDSSSFRNGVVTTTGQIRLGSLGRKVGTGGLTFEDYQRDDFRRGTSIVFSITYPSGTTAVHPRGRLRVITSSYSPEEETLTIEVGCDLVMAKLLDNEELILPYEEIPLDETTKTFEGVASSLATATKLLYQDSAGDLQTARYFGADSYGIYEAGKFVSVRGATALAVTPLAATAAIPDSIDLTYQYPVDSKAVDGQGRVDTTETQSYYYIKYPGTTFSRINNGTKLVTVSVNYNSRTTNNFNNSNSSSGNSRGCGNTVRPPRNSGGSSSSSGALVVPVACTDQFETVRSPMYVPARRTETRKTYYSGPAAQTSLETQEVYGPAIELNSQYFTDKHAYCGSVYASSCNPSPCDLFGTETVLLGKQETRYIFGNANEVTKTVTTTWRPVLAAAQPDDWRSGNDRGIPQNFNYDFGTGSGLRLYKHQEVIQDFYKEDNANVQLTTTYTSASSRGGGVGGNLDARAGIKTQQIRRSTSTVTSELLPDSVNASTTDVASDNTIIEMYGQVGGYIGNDAGPYILKEDTPVPLLYNDGNAVKEAVNRYGDYLARFIEGDARGLQIAESLRESIGTNWAPNMPFRYYDPNADKLMAFRADACSWGADVNGCIVVMNGIWVADVAGSVDLGNNLVGNATPDMSDGAPVPPTPPTNEEPVVNGPERIVNKRFNFRVNVYLDANMFFKATNGSGLRRPPFTQATIEGGTTGMWFVQGKIVQPGALVALENDGSIPLSHRGNVIVDEALIVTEDAVLFPPKTP